jgi:peroxiredoxin
MKSTRWIIIKVVVLSLCVQLFGVPEMVPAADDTMVLASSSDPMGNNSAPDFELEDLEGKKFRLSQYKGKRDILLYFWATWCPQCVASRPQIASIRERKPSSELDIFGINVGAGDSLARLKRFQKGHPVSWPILFDADGMVTETYGVQGIPLYILIDKNGEIVYRGHELPEPKYLQ